MIIDRQIQVDHDSLWPVLSPSTISSPSLPPDTENTGWILSKADAHNTVKI